MRYGLRNQAIRIILMLTYLTLARPCCGTLYYNIPRHTDEYGVVELGSIRKIDADGAQSILVSGLDNPNGIALDNAGNLYFGNIKRQPFHFEIFMLTPDNTITSDELLYTPGGVSPFWSYDIAVGPSGDIYYNIPSHNDEYENWVLGSIRKIAADGTQSILVSDLENPSGISVDNQGNVYFGNIKRHPFHFEIYMLTPDNTIASEEVLYTPGGVSPFWSYDIAVGPSGDIYYNIPSYTDEYGNWELGSIRKIQADGTRSILVSGLDNPNGIAVDDDGNVYFGNIKRQPFHFELFQLSPDGVLTGLGDVLYTPGGVSPFWSFDIAVPEPGTFLILATGTLMLRMKSRRKQAEATCPPVVRF
jgi:hypothetical protein